MNIENLLNPKYEVHIVHNEKKNYIKASGTLLSLLTALSAFVKTLKGSGATEYIINYAVKQGLLTDEDLDKETKKNIDDLIKKIFE